MKKIILSLIVVPAVMISAGLSITWYHTENTRSENQTQQDDETEPSVSLKISRDVVLVNTADSQQSVLLKV